MYDTEGVGTYILAVATATAADEGDVSTEPGEVGVQLPGSEETRRGEYDHKVTAEAQDYEVSWSILDNVEATASFFVFWIFLIWTGEYRRSVSETITGPIRINWWNRLNSS